MSKKKLEDIEATPSARLKSPPLDRVRAGPMYRGVISKVSVAAIFLPLSPSSVLLNREPRWLQLRRATPCRILIVALKMLETFGYFELRLVVCLNDDYKPAFRVYGKTETWTYESQEKLLRRRYYLSI